MNAHATVLRVEFVINANGPTVVREDYSNSPSRVKSGEGYWVYYPGCTIYFEMLIPGTTDKWLNIFVFVEDVDFQILAIDPSRYIPDMNDPKVKDALKA